MHGDVYVVCMYARTHMCMHVWPDARLTLRVCMRVWMLACMDDILYAWVDVVMHIGLYGCMCMLVCIGACMYVLRVGMCVPMDDRLYAHMSVCVIDSRQYVLCCVCVHVCMYARMRVCMYACRYPAMYMCRRLHTCPPEYACIPRCVYSWMVIRCNALPAFMYAYVGACV